MEKSLETKKSDLEENKTVTSDVNAPHEIEKRNEEKIENNVKDDNEREENLNLNESKLTESTDEALPKAFIEDSPTESALPTSENVKNVEPDALIKENAVSTELLCPDGDVNSNISQTVQINSPPEASDEEAVPACASASSIGDSTSLASTPITPPMFYSNLDSKFPEDDKSPIAASSLEADPLPSCGILIESNCDSAVTDSVRTKPVHDDNDALVPNSVPQANMVKTAVKNITPLPHQFVYKLKRISFLEKQTAIVLQNTNGPCPLLAIVNALLLKGKTSLPKNVTEVTGEDLIQTVANAFIDFTPNSNDAAMRENIQHNTDDAIKNLKKLSTGLDVNVKFSGVRDFEFTSDLTAFDNVGLNLYHGWVIGDAEDVFSSIKNLSYNQLTNIIIQVKDETLTDETYKDIEKDGLLFLENCSSQLTITGLDLLADTIADNEIAVLFRNNHFITIFKYKDQIFQLLTDEGFKNEPATWETLSDVNNICSVFVTESFTQWVKRDTRQTPPKEERVDEVGEEAVAFDDMTPQEQFDYQIAANMQMEDQSSEEFETDEDFARKLQEEENLRYAQALQEQEEQQSRREAQGRRQTPQRSRAAEQRREDPEAARRRMRKKESCTIF